jgi:hypothetical protein
MLISKGMFGNLVLWVSPQIFFEIRKKPKVLLGIGGWYQNDASSTLQSV